MEIKIRIRNSVLICLLTGLVLQTNSSGCFAQEKFPVMQYTLSMPEPSNHLYHVTLVCSGLNEDTIIFKMPQWMPVKMGKEVSNLNDSKI